MKHFIITPNMESKEVTEQEFNDAKAKDEFLYGGASVMLVNVDGLDGFALLPYQNIRQTAINKSPYVSCSCLDMLEAQKRQSKRIEAMKQLRSTINGNKGI